MAPQPAPRREGGFDAGWFMGWIALAVVIAGIILTVVWASVTAYDRFRQDNASVSATKTQQTATDAYRQGRYEEALNGYLGALKQVSGAQAVVIRGNAARSAVEVARQHIAAGKGLDAQKYAQQALELNPDSASGYVALGRALALQGDVDRAVAAFDRGAEAATRAQSPQAAEGDRKEAKEAADTLPLWKADVLYRDGVSQMAKNPMLAEQRFQAVLLAAPNSQYAKNSQIQLQQLANNSRSGAAAMPSSVSPSTLAPVGNTQMPPSDLPAAARGWDNSYQKALPRATAPGGSF
jgi:tetratricopeptide (TPR) repeat protein